MNLLPKALLIAASSLLTMALAGCGDSVTELFDWNYSKPNEQAGAAVEDVAISLRVRTAFAREPDLQALPIGVDTRDGAVVLTGMVDSEYTSDRTRAVAQTVAGVKRVINLLIIRSPFERSLPSQTRYYRI